MSRRPTAGRPSGTDGSDFAHRMVVDPRYTNVANGKSQLRSLLLVQAVCQVIGLVWFFLFGLQDERLKIWAIGSVTAGVISLIIGELGRRRSRVSLLRLYNRFSSAATAFSVACMVKSDIVYKVVQDRNLSVLTNYELLEAGRVLTCVLLQIFVMYTTISLAQNMSPPKRAS